MLYDSLLFYERLLRRFVFRSSGVTTKLESEIKIWSLEIAFIILLLLLFLSRGARLFLLHVIYDAFWTNLSVRNRCTIIVPPTSTHCRRINRTFLTPVKHCFGQKSWRRESDPRGCNEAKLTGTWSVGGVSWLRSRWSPRRRDDFFEG